MCSASQPEPITVECPPEVPDADPEEEYERLPVYVERLGILDEAEAEAEAADGWIKFEEETAATAPVVTDSGGGDVEFGNFEGGFGGSDSFGAAPSPRLAASGWSPPAVRAAVPCRGPTVLHSGHLLAAAGVKRRCSHQQ